MEMIGRDSTTRHIPNWSKWLGHLRDRPATGLEIGSLEGRSSIWFCENILTHPQSTLDCVDPHCKKLGNDEYGSEIDKELQARFLKNVDYLMLAQKLRYRNQPSEEFLRYCGRTGSQYDFIYVDGNHESKYALTDAIMSFPILKVGGILIFDDYGKKSAGVREAVDAFLSTFNRDISLLHKGWQVALRRRR